MTQARALAAVAAVLFAAAFAVAQLAGGRTQPAALEVARAEQTWITRSTSCPELQRAYSEQHSAWKAGVKAGMDANVAANLDAMRAILRRLAMLTDEGRCGG